MNVANLELCKELYELSGWHTGEWYSGQTHANGMSGTPDVPKYELGYLLRKLPKNFKTDDTRGSFQFFLMPFREWVAGYAKPEYGEFYVGRPRHIFHNEQANTPEDSVAKLCISLFKQGVLKKERKTDE